MRWGGLLDIEVIPVVDDEVAGAAMAKKFGG
ncbi:MAG: DUF3303 family protein [Verrucomicrobiota bacterium]